MRRAFRILFNAAAALSLVLCLATLAVWVIRARRAGDTGAWPRAHLTVRSGAWYAIQGWPEGWIIRRGVPLVPPSECPPGTGPAARAWSLAHQDVVTVWAGVRVEDGWGWRRPPPGAHRATLAVSQLRSVTFPHWLVALATAALPALWTGHHLRRRRRRRQAMTGRCPGCGYDLRATPDRCPECGRAASAARSDT